MEQVGKRGVTIVTLVITVIILIVLTGAVMLTMQENDIFGQTQNTVNEYNKQAALDEINLKIQTKKLEKINETGRYAPLSTEEIENIMREYGTYDEETKIVTLENGTKVSLFEITEEAISEYIQVNIEEGKLTINTQLSSEEYVIEYTTNGGNTWKEYTGEVEVGENAEVEVRVNKGTYKAGETISKSDLTVEARYSDGTRKAVTNYTYIPSTALTTSDKYVTVTYTENGVTKTATESITVTNKLVQIGAQGNIKTEYKQGESFDPTGMKVMAEYEDGSIKEVTGYTYSPTGALTESDTQVIISYTEGGETKTIPVAIEVTSMSHIEIYDVPAEMKYVKGESFDPAGITIVVHYKDGTNKTVTERFEIVNGDNLQVGQTSVTLRYTEGNITKEAEITGIVVTNNVVSIEVKTYTGKTTYNHGETFESNNTITLTARYEDNSTQEITSGYEIPNPVVQYNQTSIEVRYEGVSTQIPITVQRVLASIEVQTGTYKTGYKHGETFNESGMKLTATYTDGGTEEITSGYEIPNKTVTYGQTSVEVTCGDKSAQVPITVARELESITVTGNYQTAYVKGNNFDTTNMVVNAKYTDSDTTVPVTEYNVTNGENLQVEQGSVKVSYTENGVTKEVEVEITVTNDVVKIEITGYPEQIYKQGESFNTAGLIVTAFYEDGTNNVLNNSNIQVVGGNNLQKGTSNVTVKYSENNKEVQAQVPIVVTNNLVGIEVQASKTEYIQGESVEKGNLTVTAIYEDTRTNKEVTNYEITNGTNLQVGQTNVQISYTEEGIEAEATGDGPVSSQAKNYTATENIGITVRNNLVSVSYKLGSTKKTYNHGDTFETAGLVLTATYEDGSTKEITSGITGPAETLVYNQTSVTVSYTENGVTKGAQVTGITVNRVLESIAITTNPTLTYNYGDTFSTSNMVITATYNDGSTANVTGYTTSPENGATLSHSDTTLTVTYQGKTATKAITVNKTLQSIAVTTAPTKVAYVVGEKFSTAGMVVTATYSDNSTANVTSSCTFNPTTSTALTTSHTSVTITYQGKTTTQAITVKNPTLASQITASNYGDPVSYSANGITGWKIFYENSNGNIFLITSDYLPIAKIPSGAKMTTTGTYQAYWSSETSTQTVSSTTRSTFLSNSWSDFSTSINGKCVSTLLNTSNWTSFVNDYAEYAIGGPTVEMWTASWNAKGYTTLYCDNTNASGYYIGTSSSSTKYVVNNSSDIGYSDKLYYPYQAVQSNCYGYWLSSPNAGSHQFVYRVLYGGNVGSNFFYDTYGGLRPLVCLKSTVTATKTDGTWVQK